MRAFLPILFIVFAACEPALPQVARDAGTDAGADFDGGIVRVVTEVSGSTFTSTVAADDPTIWVGLDLDTGTEATFEPPLWDLAFSRFHIRARGGASGDGGVDVAVLPETNFEDVTSAPDGGYQEDQPDGTDENPDLDTVFESPTAWYSYNVMKHSLTPKNTVYVVRSDQGGLFKIRLQAYYDTAGTPGIIKLRWEKLPGERAH